MLGSLSTVSVRTYPRTDPFRAYRTRGPLASETFHTLPPRRDEERIGARRRTQATEIRSARVIEKILISSHAQAFERGVAVPRSRTRPSKRTRKPKHASPQKHLNPQTGPATAVWESSRRYRRRSLNSPGRDGSHHECGVGYRTGSGDAPTLPGGGRREGCGSSSRARRWLRGSHLRRHAPAPRRRDSDLSARDERS